MRVSDIDDLDRLWSEFEFFEAGHHGIDIMNPLSSEQLDRVVDAVASETPVSVLDVGCGHAEFIVRLATRVGVTGDVLDLSPWQIDRAARRLAKAGLDGVTPWLADGADFAPKQPADLTVLLGASWIWGGFGGTLDALVDRTRPGGTIVLGDLFLRDATRREVAEDTYGPLLTLDDQADALRNAALEIVAEVRTGAEDWRRYDGETAAGVRNWLEAHGRGAEHVERHRAWSDAHRDDHDVVGWTVWIARRG